MELTFEEIEQPLQHNYWSSPIKTIPDKAKVSYGDILSSLNLVVENGVLKYIQVKPNLEQSNNIEPQMQNSYIFNKYFKDYKDPSVIEEPKTPLTREEHKQAMILDYIKRVNERKRIQQIKSKKLIFNTSNINIAYKQNPINSNQLFRFSR